jgi:hypothetical protein
MQFCGFRSVIGTIWAVTDTDGRDLSEDFYEYMMSEDAGEICQVSFRFDNSDHSCLSTPSQIPSPFDGIFQYKLQRSFIIIIRLTHSK